MIALSFMVDALPVSVLEYSLYGLIHLGRLLGQVQTALMKVILRGSDVLSGSGRGRTHSSNDRRQKAFSQAFAGTLALSVFQRRPGEHKIDCFWSK